MFDEKVAAVMQHVDQLRDQVDDHWQIPRDEALLLAQIVRLRGCRSLCEIGTSYGFSTLHLSAAACEIGGHVHTIDIDPRKTEAACAHLQEAGLIDYVTLHTGDAREVVENLQPDEPFDFAFIDAIKAQCFDYLKVLMPKLANRAVVITDNTTTHADELAPFVDHLRGLKGAVSCGIPVGNGIELTLLDR
ncbi:MAG: class I SAM-dependent methyltransferase [Firmicutes bacterium]|nr:class I SAM-dependent methyltransferase [Bacillota bacterium]